jgi:hypothetical protein
MPSVLPQPNQPQRAQNMSPPFRFCSRVANTTASEITNYRCLGSQGSAWQTHTQRTRRLWMAPPAQANWDEHSMLSLSTLFPKLAKFILACILRVGIFASPTCCANPTANLRSCGQERHEQQDQRQVPTSTLMRLSPDL